MQIKLHPYDAATENELLIHATETDTTSMMVKNRQNEPVVTKSRSVTSCRWRWKPKAKRHRGSLNDSVGIVFYNTKAYTIKNKKKQQQRGPEELWGKVEVSYVLTGP